MPETRLVVRTVGAYGLWWAELTLRDGRIVTAGGLSATEAASNARIRAGCPAEAYP